MYLDRHICIKKNQYISEGSIVTIKRESNTQRTVTFSEDGVNEITISDNAFRALFKEIITNELFYYKREFSPIRILIKMLDSLNPHVVGYDEEYIKVGKKNFSRERKLIKFNTYRKHFPEFHYEVLSRIAKVKFVTEEVYFQAHETINIALETMSVYFEKLSDDELKIEISRMKELAIQLENLSNEIIEKSISSITENKLSSSLNNHKLLVDSAIDSLKKINNLK